MRLMAKNYPFIHKPYTLCVLCVLCVLCGEFLQWTQFYNAFKTSSTVEIHSSKVYVVQV